MMRDFVDTQLYVNLHKHEPLGVYTRYTHFPVYIHYMNCKYGV